MTDHNSEKSIMMIVGDVSADKHASRLVSKLKENFPGFNFFGTGGKTMKEAGVELVYDLEDFTVIGILEVVKHLPNLLKIQNKLIEEIKTRKPDLLLLVDFGTFNLIISKRIRKLFPDLPIVYFISPQIWASRPWRINTIKQNTSKMLVIFPFEETLYLKKGIDAKFVGHPLVEQVPSIDQIASKEEFLEELNMNDDGQIISIFPGSRTQEIKSHSPVIMQAIVELLEKRKELKFVISTVNEKVKDLINQSINQFGLEKYVGEKIFLATTENNFAAMQHADLIWAKSGTTTLEVAMFAKPMLIFYRGNWISYLGVLLFKTIKNIGLPNLLAEKKLVPELLQLDCSARQFVRYTIDLLDVPGLRSEIQNELVAIKGLLGKGNYISNCAEEILKQLKIKRVESN